ncbi:MAG TPA: hypothetical protein VID50_11600 [Candidatus Eisenbacteria bacterium]|jgi:hypothetical protein
MSARRSGIIAVLILVALQGCGKDKAVGPEPSEIYGTWNATEVEYVSHASPSTRVSLCDSAGGGATLIIQSDHTVAFILRCPRMAPDTTTGTWQLSADLFKMYPGGMSWYWAWEVRLSGDTLELTGADMRWDFDSDGLLEDNEEADQNMVLTR